MRYQERIYIENDNRAVRNKDILNVNMSSDICVYKAPLFGVSGATKIACDESALCNLSGYSMSDILSGMTASCITDLMTCDYDTLWTTVIYENSGATPSYEQTFFTGVTIGAVPLNSVFTTSITDGLTALGYDYTYSGSNITFHRPYTSDSLQVDLCIAFSGAVTGESCPIGYSATPANDACQQINFTAATTGATGGAIVAGDNSNLYGFYGAYFYPMIQTGITIPTGVYPAIQTGITIPVSYSGNNTPLQDATNALIDPVAVVITGNAFWSNNAGGGAAQTDRLNNIGLSALTTEFVGFSKCLDIDVAGVYYVGVAADNEAEVKIDSTLYVTFTGSVVDNFRKWSVFPFYFTSGVHVIEMKGRNIGSNTEAAFGAEVYFPTSLSALTAATSTGSSNVIFSTVEYIGGNWEIGDTIGFSCPSGYTLFSCELPPTCVQILTTDIETECTSGTCSGDCTTICDEEFISLDVGSEGVYLLEESGTTIPLVFNFTGNTDSFTANNSTFKYEVFKYNSDTGIFTLPAVFVSDTFEYSEFSGTNMLSQSISLADLPLDGEFIIKGFFEADTCTDFLRRLGKKIDTSAYLLTNNTNLYSNSDYYFIGIRKAETPIFYGTLNDGDIAYEPVSIFQQVIVVGEGLDDDLPVYEISGSVITLTHEYTGDIIVTLNGLTLAEDVDYLLSGTTLEFYGSIVNGDVITIYYTRSLTQTLVSDTISVDTAIPSGATGTEGDSSYFYNTTTGRYEIFTQTMPIPNTSVIVTLNGVTLVNGVDYVQSTSDVSRIILIGVIVTGDILNVIYYPSANVINGITTSSTTVGWYVANAPQLLNGEFELQYSTGNTFATYTVSDIVPYEIDVTTYSGILTITGDFGDQFYYRVKNTKDFETVCPDIIQSIAYSEVVPVVISSNSINSY